jgi:uncharacterized membrane protein SirB2
LLLVLFLTQFGLSVGIEELAAPARRDGLLTAEKMFFTAAYLVLGAIWLVRHRRDVIALCRFIRNGVVPS